MELAGNCSSRDSDLTATMKAQVNFPLDDDVDDDDDDDDDDYDEKDQDCDNEGQVDSSRKKLPQYY